MRSDAVHFGNLNHQWVSDDGSVLRTYRIENIRIGRKTVSGINTDIRHFQAILSC